MYICIQKKVFSTILFIANTGCGFTLCTLFVEYTKWNRFLISHSILHCQFPFEIRRIPVQDMRKGRTWNFQSNAVSFFLFLGTYETLARRESITFQSFFQLRIQRTIGYETEEQSIGEFFFLRKIEMNGFKYYWKSANKCIIINDAAYNHQLSEEIVCKLPKYENKKIIMLLNI